MSPVVHHLSLHHHIIISLSLVTLVMLRRQPTRIESKPEDVEELEQAEQKRKEQAASTQNGKYVNDDDDDDGLNA